MIARANIIINPVNWFFQMSELICSEYYFITHEKGTENCISWTCISIFRTAVNQDTLI